MKNIFIAALLMTTFLLSACDKSSSIFSSQNATDTTTLGTIKIRETDKWIGKWIGPEGTFLEIASNTDHTYQITIQNLDNSRSFKGINIGELIEFERDGHKEIIRASTGAETGMKWLSDKHDCLMIKTGEGYCRD